MEGYIPLSTCTELRLHSPETPSSDYNLRTVHNTYMKFTRVDFSVLAVEDCGSLRLQNLGSQVIIIIVDHA